MDKDLEYMKEHPGDMEWLQRKVKPRFWKEFLTQMESRPKEREEEEKRRAILGPIDDPAEIEQFNHTS